MTNKDHISYEDKLLKLDIFPLSQNQELLEKLMESGKVDIGWQSRGDYNRRGEPKGANNSKFCLPSYAFEELTQNTGMELAS